MKAVVIIPTYNEHENVGAILECVLSLSDHFEVLIVDDGSPDGTAEIVRSFVDGGRVHLIERVGKLGLGTAYLEGMRWAINAGYDYIFEMDCDFSHNPADLSRLLTAAREGADVVIGSRYISGVNVVNWPMGRLIISYYASIFVRLITRMPVRDATAGFVCWSRRVLEKMDLDNIRMKGYGFQIEMKYTAWRLGFRIREISIIFTERTAGTSKMSSSIFGEAFWGVIGLRFRKVRGRT